MIGVLSKPGGKMTIRDAKRNFVIDTATNLFLERSIGSVTIKDIASASGLGEATIYRYFSGRGELLVACALKLQERVGEKFLASSARNGYARLEEFYRAYLETFERAPELYRFLSEFDAYCVGEKVDLEEYADNIDRFKEAFMTDYGAGRADGSVKDVGDAELFYYSTAHATISLCKKLALEGNLIRQDVRGDKAAEVKTLIGIILSSLRA